MPARKKLSVQEKYEREKEQAKIRMRRRSQNMSEEQKEAKRKYDRERIARLREEKKIKRINDMTPREQRKTRKYWRERNRIRTLKKKAEEEDLVDPPHNAPAENEGRESEQKKRGRKKVRKDKAKAYRTINKLKDQIEKMEKKLRKYKKRVQRLKQNKQQKSNEPLPSPSPRKQLHQILGREKVSPQVKRQLFLGIALRKQVKNQQRKAGASKKKKQILHKVIGNEIFKKYKIQNHFKDLLPYRANNILSSGDDTFSYTRKQKAGITKYLCNTLITFFEDDRVSRMCPGKKDVVKKGATKKQRRVLLDAMNNLHQQFQTENNCKISRASFYRSRPFWVTFPKQADRETCACVKHANMEFLISALKVTNVIDHRSTREVIDAVVCSSKNINCMLSKCNKCKNNSIAFNYDEDFKVKYYKWKTVSEEKTIKNKKKIIKKTIKCKETTEVSKLKPIFQKELEQLKKHVFFYKHQAAVLKEKTEKLEVGELVFRIDFSENYVGKFSREVQSIHFGASKKQITLNTGIRFARVEDEVKTLCFASACDNLDHQAHAVWAHLKTILEQSAKEFPGTHTVHFFSDSPTSQYRNRTNMYLFNTQMLRYFPNLVSFTWNFTEAGHGKGEMDGVGGTIKRGADRKVLYGKDITCAKEFVDELKDFDIQLYEVPSTSVEQMKLEVASLKIPPITGIMQIHQISFSKCGPTFGNKLSCFDCSTSGGCKHFKFCEINLDGDCSTSTSSSRPVTSSKKKKLRVDDVYTSEDSDEDGSQVYANMLEEQENIKEDNDCLSKFGVKCSNADEVQKELGSGVYIVVEYVKENKRKRDSKQFIGVCQSEMCNNDIDVMFLKPCLKDKSLYVLNESDVASVRFDQIKAILQTPSIILKGKRVFYKFLRV